MPSFSCRLFLTSQSGNRLKKAYEPLLVPQFCHVCLWSTHSNCIHLYHWSASWGLLTLFSVHRPFRKLNPFRRNQSYVANNIAIFAFVRSPWQFVTLPLRENVASHSSSREFVQDYGGSQETLTCREPYCQTRHTLLLASLALCRGERISKHFLCGCQDLVKNRRRTLGKRFFGALKAIFGSKTGRDYSSWTP